MIKKFLLLCFIGCLAMGVKAQTGYVFRISFQDKVGGMTIADSLQFLSQKALDRRSKQGIAVDVTDIPVVQSYINGARTACNGLKIFGKSKWLNHVLIITHDSNLISAVQVLPYVTNTKLVAVYPNYNPKRTGDMDALSARKFPEVKQTSQKTTSDPAYYGNTFQQINIHNGDYLHDQGLWGQGMTIAVLDAGFQHTDTHTQFDSLRNSGRLLATYNFVYDTSYVLGITNDHGTNVTGLIIAEDPTSYIGAAPKANIYQLLTEDIYTEQPIEEDNWLEAAEWADSAGVDIINGSLGYNEFSPPHTSYTWAGDFDGNTTVIAQAANMAVSKGIFTCVAQGNSGSSPWHYMLTPADADSAFSVGSVDGSGAWANSGYGPNADGQTKPNVVAMGKDVWLIGGNGLPGTSNGSSFASPLMAGMVACLWQGFPSKTESEIRHLVMQVSDRFTTPNNTHGFGIPNFKLAYSIATGVDEFEVNNQSNFKVYPNPTNGSFSLRVKQDFLPYDFEMYDIRGQKIGGLKNVNSFIYGNQQLQELPTGTYFIRLNSKGRSEQTMIIKN